MVQSRGIGNEKFGWGGGGGVGTGSTQGSAAAVEQLINHLRVPNSALPRWWLYFW
jgi:hypothetical protein